MRSQDAVTTLVELADTLVSDYELLSYLERLLSSSVVMLDAAAGGVMLASPAGDLQLLACTDERTRVLELFELQRAEGPCVDSHRSGRLVVDHDLSVTRRWPQFAPAAVSQGYHAVFAFPMRLRGSTIGALNIFRAEAGSVPDGDLSITKAFADMATIGILNQRAVRQARELSGQLQAALNSRVVIEQAKGVLAERLGYEIDQAYQALRWFARNRNLSVREVAALVVAGELPAAAFGPSGDG